MLPVLRLLLHGRSHAPPTRLRDGTARFPPPPFSGAGALFFFFFCVFCTSGGCFTTLCLMIGRTRCAWVSGYRHIGGEEGAAFLLFLGGKSIGTAGTTRSLTHPSHPPWLPHSFSGYTPGRLLVFPRGWDPRQASGQGLRGAGRGRSWLAYPSGWDGWPSYLLGHSLTRCTYLLGKCQPACHVSELARGLADFFFFVGGGRDGRAFRFRALGTCRRLWLGGGHEDRTLFYWVGRFPHGQGWACLFV